MISDSELDINLFPSSSSFKVELIRNGIIESVHRIHALVCNSHGSILLGVGNSHYETFVRSALKPFQAIPFARSNLTNNQKDLAIACSSHNGTPIQIRAVLNLLHQSSLNANLLKCPIPIGYTSALEHNCSGKHASFLATCKYMGWDLEGYLEYDHPLQNIIIQLIKDLLGTSQTLIMARDDCGAPTFKMELYQIALLYCHISDLSNLEIKSLISSMLIYPGLVAGEGRFDTELMNKGHRQIVSKGGAEGIQCISHLKKKIAIAIKVEDGSRRAKQAAAIYFLKKLQWLEDEDLLELEKKFLIVNKNVNLRVNQ